MTSSTTKAITCQDFVPRNPFGGVLFGTKVCKLERGSNPPQTSRKMTRNINVGRHAGRVLIAGAGIAGLATAAALQKVGIPAVVLEREDGPRLQVRQSPLMGALDIPGPGPSD